MINDLESRLSGIVIDTGHCAQAFKVQLALDAAERFEDVRRRNFDGQLVELELGCNRDIVERGCERVIAQTFRNHFETNSCLRGCMGVRSRRRTGFAGARSECAQSSTPFFQMKKNPARIRTTKVSISRKPNIFSCLNTTAHG